MHYNQIIRDSLKPSPLAGRSLLRNRLGISVLALLCVSAAVRADDQVPFKATFVGWDYASFPDQCTIIVRHVDEGQATELGRCSYTSTTLSDGCSGSLAGHDDDVVLTAANGDQLFGTSVDISSQVDSSDPTKVQIVGESIITITGGTGRFAQATGTFQWSFIAKLYEAIPLPDGTLLVPNVFSLDGTVTSVGSDKN
jgi:hypothetical protein